MSINLFAVVTCTVAAFVMSTIWYMMFGKARAQLLGFDSKRERRPKPQNILLELLRTFLLALVFAIVLSELKDSSRNASLLLGLRLWLAFPLILLSGSVLWDKVPKKLAAIHAGDWVIKLMLIALIVGSWR
jgi:glycerol uptake facilitator-like aquaporin